MIIFARKTRWLIGIESEVVEDAKSFTTISTLFFAWKEWAIAAGEYIGKRKELKEWLIKKGFRETKEEQGIGFWGLSAKKYATTDAGRPAQSLELM